MVMRLLYVGLAIGLAAGCAGPRHGDASGGGFVVLGVGSFG